MPKPKKSDVEKTATPKALKPLKTGKPAPAKKEKKKESAAIKETVEPAKKPAKIEKKTALVEKLKKTILPEPSAAPAPVITLEDVQLRAYFIAERRQAMGWEGDSSQDWIEAERQLAAEAKKKARR